jgi:hypothetical protein
VKAVVPVEVEEEEATTEEVADEAEHTLSVYSMGQHNEHNDHASKRSALTAEQVEFLRVNVPLKPLRAHEKLTKQSFGKGVEFKTVESWFGNYAAKVGRCRL